MKTYEFLGKNIEKAIEAGLKELNKNRDDVDIKIISEGGLFSKAKIEISVEDDEEMNDLKQIVKDEIDEIAKEEDNESQHREECDEVEHSCCCEDEQSFCCCEDEIHCCCEEECECEDICECGCKENEEINENIKPEKVYLTSEEVFTKIQDIFANIFKNLNLDAKVMILENDEAYEVKVMGDERVSSLIGFRGEGLNAYQLLINNFMELRNKEKKILIDVENYRNRREESLRSLAQRIAKKVVKTKRRHKFEPMSSYERHVIHEELANFDGVTTHSEGNEPHRCLIVDIKRD